MPNNSSNKKVSFDFENVFSDEWCNNVLKAADYAIQNNSTNMSDEELRDYIINYNVTKRLEDEVLVNILGILPEKLDWRSTSKIDAFHAFKEIIDCCNICPNFNKFKTKITLDDDSELFNELYFWIILANNEYKHLSVDLEYITDKKYYLLTVSRLK